MQNFTWILIEFFFSFQTFLELQNDTMSAPYQAGFVPPAPAPIQMSQPPQFTNLTSMPAYTQAHVVPTFMIEQDQQSMESLDNSSMSDASWQTPPPPIMMDDFIGNNSNSNSNSLVGSNNKGRPRSQNNKSAIAGTTRRNTGGRKPNKPSNLSPEEEEKRRVRRERNKLAAARCRRRREDHTQELVDETEGLERKKQQMQNEISELTQQRDHLLMMLEAHKDNCNVIGGGRQSPPDIKPNVVLIPNGVSMGQQGQKRPHSLATQNHQQNQQQQIVFTATTSASVTTTSSVNNLSLNFSNINNNHINHNNINNNNSNMLNANGLSEKIKSEPVEFYDDEPPRKK